MAPPIPYPILSMLRRCHELELLMEQVYSALAKAHGSHTRTAALWLKTSKEEANHASQFSLAMSLSGDVISSTVVETEEIDKAIQEAEEFLREVRKEPPDVETSLRKAIRLEEGMAAFHLHAAVTFESASHAKLFRAMMAADKAHVASLQAELARLEG
jgi:rubrerythrin